MNKYLVIMLLIIVSALSLFAASSDNKAVEQETVSFLETTNYNDALQILETFSWKYERKKIINLSKVDDQIGVPIHNLTWRKALELIVLKKELVIEETPGAIITKSPDVVTAGGEISKPKELQEINTKQVRISAVAFTCDKAFLRSLGIDWSTILDGKVDASINFGTANYVPSPVLNAEASNSWGLGNGYTLDVNTLLSTIESNELGTIIARPSVIVSSGKKGFIQVGQDVSIKSVDDAGNTTDEFFQTGVIMDVLPTILVADDDSTEVIHLVANVERSSATPGSISTIINKNIAITDVILYNGEETVIGGLYNTEDITTRAGIPFLRDLPWWVFGIRYLTGYTKIDKKERELVIIIKADIMDNAITRLKKAK
jgi:type IV pilus assembly protein PilQ